MGVQTMPPRDPLAPAPLAPSDAVPIPKTIGDVDAAWLTKALAVERPGIVVHSAEIVQSLGGACTKLRMAVRTNRDDFPPTVIVKGCFEPHNQIMALLQVREVDAYRKVVPHLAVETVRWFFAGGDPERGAALVLEDLDLRDVSCLRIQEPIGYDLAAAFLEQVAQIHARWWGSPDIAEGGSLSWIKASTLTVEQAFAGIVRDPATCGQYLKEPRGAATPKPLHDIERLKRAFGGIYTNQPNLPVVLCHGDLHPANLYVDAEGRPGLLDWTLKRGPWAADVSYFIAGALDVCDRRRWEAPLLQVYLSSLAAHGVAAPSFDEAWFGYRCWHVYGLTVWLFNSTNYHTESAIAAATARHAAAVIDHDAFGLLGA